MHILGLAELLGFELERDMKTTLYVVRRLQRWTKKEFVLLESSDGGTLEDEYCQLCQGRG